MGKENLSLSSNRFPIFRRNKRRDKKFSISFRPLQMVGNGTLPFVQKLVLTLISRGEIKRRDAMHVWRDTHSVFPPISPTRMTYFPRTLALLSPTNKCRGRKARRGRMEMKSRPSLRQRKPNSFPAITQKHTQKKSAYTYLFAYSCGKSVCAHSALQRYL